MFISTNYAKLVVPVFIIIGFLCLGSGAVFAGNVNQSPIYGVAIKGYDPVAYFTENHAVKGSSEFSYTWNEANWHFSNPENRALFAANPEKYAPKHGGFCAVSLIAGKVAIDNPEEWKIIDGNLYLGWE